MKNTTPMTINTGFSAYKALIASKAIHPDFGSEASKVTFVFGENFTNTLSMKIVLNNTAHNACIFRRRSGMALLLSARNFDCNSRDYTECNVDIQAGILDAVPDDTDFVGVLKEDVSFLYDLEVYISKEAMKQRKFHTCKDCGQNYRERCACLNVAKIKDYGQDMSGINFFDNVNGKTLIRANSGNVRSESKKAFIGLEWELGNRNRKSKQSMALQLFKGLKNDEQTKHFLDLFISTKEDSTIDGNGNGFELVTNPFSSKYYEANQESFELMAQSARQMKLRGSGNGIHIHISRNAFNKNGLAKWFKLLANNTNVLQLIAGRNRSTYSEIRFPVVSEMNSKLSEDLELKHNMNTARTDADFNRLANQNINGAYSFDRYSFLNLNNSKTIEYRLPASTTDKSGDSYSNFCRHIEFMLASYEYTMQDDLKLKDVSFFDFFEYLEKQERFVNLFNCIVSNDSALTLIVSNQNAEKLIKANDVKSNIEIDATSEDSIELAREQFELLLNEIKPISEATITEIVNEKKGKLKPKKEVK
jgi:hypothetical protein